VAKGCVEFNSGVEKKTIALGCKDQSCNNRTIKADCLDEIGKQFGVTCVEVKEKLGNLRRQFHREHLKVKKVLKVKQEPMKFTSLGGMDISC
jgi:hypothetical protein